MAPGTWVGSRWSAPGTQAFDFGAALEQGPGGPQAAEGGRGAAPKPAGPGGHALVAARECF